MLILSPVVPRQLASLQRQPPCPASCTPAVVSDVVKDIGLSLMKSPSLEDVGVPLGEVEVSTLT